MQSKEFETKNLLTSLLERKSIQLLKSNESKKHVEKPNISDFGNVADYDPSALLKMQKRYLIDDYSCSICDTDELSWDYLSMKPQEVRLAQPQAETDVKSNSLESMYTRTIAR